MLLGHGVSSDGGTSIAALNSFVQLHMTTIGSDSFSDSDFSDIRSIVFVIDLLGDYVTGISEFLKLVELVILKGFEPNFDIFLHKSDGLNSKDQLEIQNDITSQIKAENSADIEVNFHLTSLYDYSILNAISSVLQRFLKNKVLIMKLLDGLCKENQFRHAFIIDKVSKIYLSSDSFIRDEKIYYLCADSIDVVEDLCSIYCTSISDRRKEAVATIVLNIGQIMYLPMEHGMALLAYSDKITNTDVSNVQLSLEKICLALIGY